MAINFPKGFTLIELMIVIAIIGILAAIAVPQFSAYRMKGCNTGAKSDVKNASIAQQAFYVDNRTYTGSLDDLTAAGYRPTQDVTLNVSGNDDAYTITGYHGSGDKTYTLAGPGGTITSNQRFYRAQNSGWPITNTQIEREEVTIFQPGNNLRKNLTLKDNWNRKE